MESDPASDLKLDTDASIDIAETTETKKRRSALSPIVTQPHCSTPPVKKTPPCQEKDGPSSDSSDNSSVQEALPISPVTTKRGRSNRRSSFVTGRKSILDLQSAPVAETRIDIPYDLADDERLLRLHNAVLECTLSRISIEFSDQPGAQQLTVQVRDVGQSVLRELQEQGKFKDATSQPQRNPGLPCSDAKLEAAISQKEALRARYADERREWERLLEEREKQASDASGLAKRASRETQEPCPDLLSVAQRNLLTSRPDYQHKLNKLTVLEERMSLMGDQVRRVVGLMKASSDLAQQYVQASTKQLYHQSFPVPTSPRSLLSKRQIMPNWTQDTHSVTLPSQPSKAKQSIPQATADKSLT